MGVQERAAVTERKLQQDRVLHRFKHQLDGLLPAAMLLLIAVLYLEFLAHRGHPLYPYKQPMKLAVLGYFLVELGVDFIIYERHTTFVRERWLDILLTVPFFTAFKSVRAILHITTGLKLVKPAKMLKGTKTVKAGRIGAYIKPQKAVQNTQKLGKLVTKGKKLVKKTTDH